ncbi:MAG: hypothetical protein LKE51_11665 [Selenomonas sp.]|nr:hypothetical protein [Selenomonas sp.]
MLEEADRCPLKYVDRVKRCADKVGAGRGEDTICFEASTGLISCEELVLSTLNSVLLSRHIAVFGGTAWRSGPGRRKRWSRLMDRSGINRVYL